MMNNPMQLLQMLPQIKANPMQFLQRKFNLPNELSMNDPQAIVNHLLQTGQVSQQQINAVYQQMGQFRR